VLKLDSVQGREKAISGQEYLAPSRRGEYSSAGKSLEEEMENGELLTGKLKSTTKRKVNEFVKKF